MGNMDQAFTKFFETTKITPGMQQQISERIAALTKQLQRLVGTPEVLPIGSYARGTLAPPVRDADVLFVLKKTRENQSPAQTLQELQGPLAQTFTAKRRIQRHSVRVDFVDFAIDVVPAFGDAGRYEIPELFDFGNPAQGGRWLVTDPRAHEEHLRRANGMSNGLASRLTLTLKSMNQAHTSRVKSFPLEAWVIAQITQMSADATPFAQALPEWLDRVASGIENHQGMHDVATVRTEVAHRFRNHAGTLREALRHDDVALARKVVPGL